MRSRARFPIAMLATALIAAAPVGAAGPDDSPRIILKFVKRAAGSRVVFDPASCPACTPVTDPHWNADNSRETIVALSVPRLRGLELAFRGGATVDRVLIETGDLAFRRAGGRLIVPLPPVASDAITAGEVATHIVEPGMVLRFEHADPARRAGAYAAGAFPALQRAAADTLEFAQREVVRELGLGEEAERRGLGLIQIMGFDTNAPHGHLDAPPHVHMHLRWPGNSGTQIGHYFIGADGLLTHNIVGVKGGTGERRFARGQAFTTTGPDGREFYTHRITAEGWLDLGRAGAPPCRIRPDSGTRGFADGATIACPGKPVRRLTVRDDLSRGVMTVTTDRIREIFRYDRDTGRLLSPTELPPAPPSVFVAPG